MATPAAGTRYITIHGHFYQPPRENPWLETVETQDSAAPYHDWNERITAECYAPNGAARMVDGDNLIVRIMNNYGRISFNIGPTLLSWLEENAPRTDAMVRAADKLSRRRFGGHGSAMAQVYNHIIMPLASTRDRITQIRWGIADFEHRFQRKPEGMWLAETAVDGETLELLAEHGIRFTVLAPSQCAAVRPLADMNAGPAREALPWSDTPDASVDTTQPYLIRLKTGRSIAVFFYNGPVSRAIAFEGLLNNGENFAARLLGGFHADGSRPQLVHVATDGESYGHHHRHGEMALAAALRVIEEGNSARLTNYGEFLALFPPVREAKIHENTSWSCFHGVERWRSNCGCSGGAPGFHQQWRAPLRAALDWLRDTLRPLIDEAGSVLLRDVEEARNDYIRVVLNRGRDAVDGFLADHARRTLTPEERERVLELMELERNALLMYTSCGWFFDELSGIETVQIVAYACRAIELATGLFGGAAGPGALASSLEDRFVARLALAKSNVPELGDGAAIYAKLVKSMQIGLEQVAAHYAISSVFSGGEGSGRELYCYRIDSDDRRVHRYGGGQVILGRARVTSLLTEATASFSYAVLHFGDQNLTAAVKRYGEADAGRAEALKKAVERAVAAADLPEVVRLVDGYFGESAYSLTSLFRDEQRRIVNRILLPTLEEMESSLAAIYRDHASLLHFLSRAGLPKPAPLSIAAQFAVNTGLRHAMEEEPIDAARILELLEMARTDMVVLDTDRLSYLADQRMKQAMVRLQQEPANVAALEYAFSLARTLHTLPFGLNLWQAQNIWYDLHLQGSVLLSGAGPATLTSWQQIFPELGRQLSIDVNRLMPETNGFTEMPAALSADARDSLPPVSLPTPPAAPETSHLRTRRAPERAVKKPAAI